MANFWDLPKPIREKIYRLHLVHDQPITQHDFLQLCIQGRRCSYTQCNVKTMPRLLQADRKIEREAAHIYFGENTFEVSEPSDLYSWAKLVHKRHYNRIRKVLLKIPRLRPRNSAADNEASLLKLGTMRGLESLTVELDERETIKAMVERSRRGVQWHESLGYGPQVQLHVMHLDGMHVLRAMRGLKHVEFRSPRQQINIVQGGILPLIGREMMKPLELEA